MLTHIYHVDPSRKAHTLEQALRQRVNVAFGHYRTWSVRNGSSYNSFRRAKLITFALEQVLNVLTVRNVRLNPDGTLTVTGSCSDLTAEVRITVPADILEQVSA